MNAKGKFVLGAGLVILTVGFLMAEGIKDTGVYFLMPAELAERVAEDSSMYDVGIRVGGNVVGVDQSAEVFDVGEQVVENDVGERGPHSVTGVVGVGYSTDRASQATVGARVTNEL